ncbi:TPA: type I toxin-antitoxin system endodeoxyribonuclease toxin RalR [Escherichia coli]|nr:type I toxin-antitoxin system endodeoxyribonuclease toxin RalR [Escherichia coli]
MGSNGNERSHKAHRRKTSFCGCPSVTVKAISGYYRAKCNGCESRTGYGESEKEALERWNKRTTGNNNGGVHV